MTHATWGFEINSFSLSQQSLEMLIKAAKKISEALKLH